MSNGFDFRVTSVCPAPARDTMNKIGEALGHGPGVWSLPLSTTGQEPPTHFATSTVCRQGFVALLTNPAVQEPVLVSTDWTEVGLTEEQARVALRQMRDASPPTLLIGLTHPLPPESLPPGLGGLPVQAPDEQLSLLMQWHGISHIEPGETPQ